MPRTDDVTAVWAARENVLRAAGLVLQAEHGAGATTEGVSAEYEFGEAEFEQMADEALEVAVIALAELLEAGETLG